ncbi:hypothetical protein MBOT_12260 [Mycobacterium botniense]|uniref:Uncharacterized protein n=1 Tax=Mycobacterium botniense TaxID=84962 RepID=A0A7I9XVP4_9MYCO|nr:hypothetical protein MBOT_12260 [Mycobacterium botniense]
MARWVVNYAGYTEARSATPMITRNPSIGDASRGGQQCSHGHFLDCSQLRDDPEMERLLEPMWPHRYRAVRLLEVSGLARLPRFASRAAIRDLSAL